MNFLKHTELSSNMIAVSHMIIIQHDVYYDMTNPQSLCQSLRSRLKVMYQGHILAIQPNDSYGFSTKYMGDSKCMGNYGFSTKYYGKNIIE